MNKAINIQSTVEVDDENVAYMSCQIGCSVDMLNLSIQVINKELYAKNKTLVAEKCTEFIKESLQEAVSQGWDIIQLKL